MIETVATELFEAFQQGKAIAPLSPELTVDDAYAIQGHLVALHERAGRQRAGHKVGLTSAAMREQLGVDSPDFGILFDTHTFENGATLDIAALNPIAARIEAEIGFILATPLGGNGEPVTAADVRAATASVLPVFELVDSRILDWKIGLVDTVADNASGFGAVLGTPVALEDIGPLADVRLRFSLGDEVLGEGTGDAVMGDPAEAVAWLATELGRRGTELPAGQPILSGSFTAAPFIATGDYVADFGAALGTVSVTIA